MTREEIWNKAYKRIFELYGENPDLNIVNRLLSEKAALAHLGVGKYFEEIAHILEESVTKYNEKLVAKASVTSCLLAYLLGASSLNPLPTHYYCPKCKRVEWVDDLDNDKCLFDMRATRTCECGAEMRIDGYNLPYESYVPYAKRLKAKDPVPENYADLFDSLINTHFQKSLLGAAQAVHLLKQAAGVDEIDLSDREVKYRLLGGDFSCMHPKLAEFLKQAYEVVKPQSYNELLQLVSFSKGTNTWRNNGEDLLKNYHCRLADIPASRDEVFMMIRDAMRDGVYDAGFGFAYDVANKARKGYYFEHGMDGYTIDTLKSLGFGEWFASYLLGVRYMSTKALSILELRYIIMLTYFKLYYSHEYQEVIAGEDIWQPN